MGINAYTSMSLTRDGDINDVLCFPVSDHNEVCDILTSPPLYVTLAELLGITSLS